MTAETEKKFILPEIKLLCNWKGLKLAASKKQDFVSAYVAAARPPSPEPRTIEDEQALLNIQSHNTHLKDTALGVAAKQMAVAVTANMGKLNANSRHLLLQSLAKFDSNVDDESLDGTGGVVWCFNDNVNDKLMQISRHDHHCGFSNRLILIQKS